MKRILIIDDEQHIREHYCKLLTDKGFHVDTAENGTSGLAKFREGEYDLVLLDVNMPDKSGLEVLKEIKGIKDSQVVFLLTAYEEYKRNFASLYAEEYFTKDKKIEILLRRINEHLEG
ncbi:response regulator [Seleniivibrio woodruffii]|uniref:Response regulator receiver domain-containing protein n=1 Tax=Seleniivibrio woodruffii TaxID=1078050 RepID=A0A4R1KEJ8_9BACT|nr:response regulator [Seleniivibrio woodruffii]TCK61699.1 response regulator receiver domain-containing protein [Seleniivibrio woodruffii]TVZ35186.1 response regulator receiver domain-containing protein [Seleniivibrio woodruffii]